MSSEGGFDKEKFLAWNMMQEDLARMFFGFEDISDEQLITWTEKFSAIARVIISDPEVKKKNDLLAMYMNPETREDALAIFSDLLHEAAEKEDVVKNK